MEKYEWCCVLCMWETSRAVIKGCTYAVMFVQI